MNMLLMVGLLIAACALGIIASALYQKWARRRIGSLTFKQKTFITRNELDFYKRLVTAVGSQYTVLAQVGMGALIDTALNPKHPMYWEVRAMFSGRICDFVLCHKETLKPVLVVELDDVMHDFSRDEKRDTFLAQAGLATVRFWSRNKPTPDELRKKIEQSVKHI